MQDDLVLRDAMRDREIPLRIYRPATAAPGPLIVFSHGLGGSKTGYRYLAEFWAAHGFAVLVPTHFGSDESIYGGGRPQRQTEPARRAARDPRNWRDRPLDISFVLSSLDQIPDLRIDRARIGVGGHSFGTYTAAALAGMEVAMPDEGIVSFRDERPRAFLGMSPQGPGDMPFRESGWAAIRRPFLLMTGTLDRGYDGQPPEWRLQPFRHIGPGDKYLAVLRDADHLTFAGVGTRAKAAFLDPVRELTLAFWQAYLLGDETARTRLTQASPAFSRFEHK